jgi:hypothetical protein
MATSSITFVVRVRWWVKPALRLCAFMGVEKIPKCLGKAVTRWGISLTLLKDKDLGHGPQA